MTTVRLQKVGNAIMATIPRLLLTQLKMLRGDTVQVELKGHSILFTPIERRAVGLSPAALADRRTPRPAAEEDE